MGPWVFGLCLFVTPGLLMWGFGVGICILEFVDDVQLEEEGPAIISGV